MIKSAIHLGTVIGVLLLCSPVSSAAEQTPQRPPTRRPAPAPKQPSWPSDGWLGLSAGYQTRSFPFEEVHTDTKLVEESTWQANYKLRDGLSFDGGGGARVWRNLVVSGAYSLSRDDNAAAITGSIAHPFFFNQFRSISGDSQQLRQDEHAVHISAMWMIPVSRSFEIGVFGGPSYFWVNRAFVKDVEYTESYPYDTATFTGVVVDEASANQLGVHAGVDVTWLFTRQVGVGALVRYSRGSVDFSTPAGGSLSVDVGGLQLGAGLRVRFARKPPPGPRQPASGTRPPVNAPPAAPGTMPATVGTAAVTIASAPVFIRPDETRTPLRTLPRGTSVRVLDEQGDWLRIEFQDSQWGRRVGYVQRKYIQMGK